MKKTVLMVICVLLCLVWYGCKPAPDYYAALQYEWKVIEKPASWRNDRYVFTAERTLETYDTNGVDTWLESTFSVDEVYATSFQISRVVNGVKEVIIVDYTLSNN
ncbi:MAG TPA: hypothetical protein PLG87_10995, partial [Treponemataceae bacterium]|nr:hypothetical protein [Treponemataceae bacterium]